ncbi:MAG: hypothetical protein Q8L70_08650 [Methylotenera sp.]|nr:hypothetical protein [Methylotenera sp.]MDP1958917.1 hypothetical protein [Methylotenera sp.]MDP3943531.1 hypothetical protein [Methylotenera sp.]
MVFPDKHIRFSESLLGLGSFVLASLNTSSHIDNLWQELKKTQNHDGLFSTHNFENLVLAVDILFALGLLKMTPGGFLQLNETTNLQEIASK